MSNNGPAKIGKLLLKGGRVFDPVNKLDTVTDVLIDKGKIQKIGSVSSKSFSGKMIDCKDKLVVPGLTDIHVHLREPGREDKETIKSGTAAAVKGGATSVLAMPNTEPAIDSEGVVELIKNIIKKNSHNNVYICGAITKGREGQELVEIEKLKKKGVIAISDDGTSVDSEEVFLKALKQSKKEDILVICHSEDKTLSAKGVVNLGLTSTRLGLRGISKESEYKRIERDIELARKADARIHIAHVSCAESVELISKAKKQGVKITAETAPHYFSLTEEAVWSFDTNKKMNPPLRGKDDVIAIKEGLKNRTIDAIASDHAPHTQNEKDIEFDRAEFGVTGVETILSVTITELVDKGILSWPQAVAKLALNPAQILGIEKGSLSKGASADIVVVDPKKEWTVTKESSISKSKNSAFLGKTLKGVVEYTIHSGKIVYERE